MHSAPAKLMLLVLVYLLGGMAMAKWPELLNAWGVPHTQRFGTTLVAREDAPMCLERVYGERCRFYGYDAFILSSHNDLTPCMEWCPAWEAAEAPPLEELLNTIRSHPSAVTHYEFVFESAS